MIDENTIVKLNKNILKRFEHNLNGGTLFLFDTVTDEVWMGNESSRDLIKLIDGKKRLKEIYTQLAPFFEGYKYNELKESFDAFICSLIDKKFLEYIDF